MSSKLQVAYNLNPSTPSGTNIDWFGDISYNGAAVTVYNAGQPYLNWNIEPPNQSCTLAIASTPEPTYTWTFYSNGVAISTVLVFILQSFDSRANQDVLTISYSIHNLPSSPYHITKYGVGVLTCNGGVIGSTNSTGQLGIVDLPMSLIGLRFPRDLSAGSFALVPTGSCGIIFSYAAWAGPPSDNQYPPIQVVSRSPYSLAPGASDEFNIQMRFGLPTANLIQLAGPTPNYYDNWKNAHPFKLNWPDRRPINEVFVSSQGQLLGDVWPPMVGLNIDGTYALDPKCNAVNIDPATATSMFNEFRLRLLAAADSQVISANGMNAQGVITWDVEGLIGTYVPEMDTYIGDISQAYTVTPVLGWVSHDSNGMTLLQEYFNVYLQAGLRAGVTIRSETYNWNKGYQPSHVVTDSPPRDIPYPGGAIPKAVKNLMDRIAFGKQLGVSIFYFDSPQSVSGIGIHPSWFELVTNAHPDVLLCPENPGAGVTNATYRVAIPYHEMRMFGTGAVTPPEVRYTYPDAGTLILTNEYANGIHLCLPPNDTPPGLFQAIKDDVRKGSILLSQGCNPIVNVVRNSTCAKH